MKNLYRKINIKNKINIMTILFFILLLCHLSLVFAAIPESERQALIDLYNSTGGDNWHNNSGWMGEAGSECDWYGIMCNSEKTHVIKFDLHRNGHGNNLDGKILQSIENLTNLTTFLLGHNNLKSVPPEIGNLTNLTDLSLSNTKLTSVPPSGFKPLIRSSVFKPLIRSSGDN